MKSHAEMTTKSDELVGHPVGSVENDAGWLLRELIGEEEGQGFSEAGIHDMLLPLGNSDTVEAEAQELVRKFIFPTCFCLLGEVAR